MAAVNVGTAYVELLPSARGFTDKVRQEIGGDIDHVGRDAGDRAGKQFAGSFTSHFKGIAVGFGSALAAAGIGAVLVDSVQKASNLGEAISKNNVVFGEHAQVIRDWAKTTGDSMGISERQALTATGTFGNLLKAMGATPENAMAISKEFVGLAADLASFNDASPEEVLEALRSGLVGETEPLKRFGVNLNEARLKAEALSLGLISAEVDTKKLSTAQESVDKATRAQAKALTEHGAGSQQYADATRDLEQANASLAEVMEGKVPAALTDTQKAYAAHALIMKDTTDAQGDFARTQDSFANQQRTLAANVDELQVKLGSLLLPIVNRIATFILKTAIPAIERFGRAVVDGFRIIADVVRSGGTEHELRAGWVGAFERVGLAALAVKEWFQRNWPTIKDIVVTAGQAIWTAIKRIVDVFTEIVRFIVTHQPVLIALGVAIGVGLVAAFVSWAVAAASAAIATLTAMAPVIALAAAIGVLVAGVIWAYQNWGWFRDAVDAVVRFLKNPLWPILQTIGEVIGKVVVGFIRIAIDAIGLYIDIWRRVITTVIDVVRWVIDRVGDMIGFIQGLPGRVAGFLGSVFDPIVRAAASAVQWVADRIDDMWRWITGLPGRVSGAFGGMFDGLKDAFRSAVNWVIRAWNGLNFSIPSITVFGQTIGGQSFGTPDIPLLASGGVITTPTLSVVGEAGPEAVIPLRQLPDIARRIVSGTGTGDGATTRGDTIININQSGLSDPDVVARKVAFTMRTTGR